MTETKRAFGSVSLKEKTIRRIRKINKRPVFDGMTISKLVDRALDLLEKGYCPECERDLDFKSCNHCRGM